MDATTTFETDPFYRDGRVRYEIHRDIADREIDVAISPIMAEAALRRCALQHDDYSDLEFAWQRRPEDSYGRQPDYGLPIREGMARYDYVLREKPTAVQHATWDDRANL